MSRWQNIVFKFNRLFQVSPLAIPTWLAIGAALQTLSLLLLPASISTLLPLLYIGYRVVKTRVDGKGVYQSTFTSVKRGRWTSELPEPEDPSKEKGIVMFILAARFNHPMQLLAPVQHDLGKAFADMWAEAETNSKQNGFLGRTTALHDPSDTEGLTLTWMTYWRSLEGLQAFATSAAHRVGEINYAKSKYPFLGIMHETYHAPNGSWETVNHNMPPWGLAKIANNLGTLRKTSAGTKKHDASMSDRMRSNQNIAAGALKDILDGKSAL